MNDRKVRDSLENLGKALGKLEEALLVPKDSPLAAEGTIQRSEYVIELFWKTFKRALEYEGIITKTPRESVKAAFQAEWMSDETTWLKLLDSRNRTSHLYLHHELVDQAYTEIKESFPELKATYQFLSSKFQ